jgi:hypothetical protein
LVWDDVTGKWEQPTDNWGELRFCSAAPGVGAEWTDDGARREPRHLKSRPQGEWRQVPIAPPLTRILRAHLDQFSTGLESRVFTGVRGGELPSITYRRVWDKARFAALTHAEYESPREAPSSRLMRRAPLRNRTVDLLLTIDMSTAT